MLSIPNRANLTFLVPLGIFLFSVGLSCSPILNTHPELAIGITYDLALLTPLAYLWVIWKKEVPKITIVPVFVVGVFTANAILPDSQQMHVDLLKNYLLPLLELGVIGFIGFTVYQMQRKITQHAAVDYDTYQAIRLAALDTVKSPKIAQLLASEIAMIYYSFSWRKKKNSSPLQFTNFKKSGAVPFFYTVLFIVAIETAVLHLLLVEWNGVIAWVLTLSSMYAGIQLFGHVQALRLRPHTFNNDSLQLRYGIMGDIAIPYQAIERIEATSGPLSNQQKTVKLALFKDFEAHNIVIYCKTPQQVHKLYGLKAESCVILCYVDDKENFISSIQERIL